MHHVYGFFKVGADERSCLPQVLPPLAQPTDGLTMLQSEAAAAHGDDVSKEPSPAKGPETPGKRRVTSAA